MQMTQPSRWETSYLDVTWQPSARGGGNVTESSCSGPNVQRRLDFSVKRPRLVPKRMNVTTITFGFSDLVFEIILKLCSVGTVLLNVFSSYVMCRIDCRRLFVPFSTSAFGVARGEALKRKQICTLHPHSLLDP